MNRARPGKDKNMKTFIIGIYRDENYDSSEDIIKKVDAESKDEALSKLSWEAMDMLDYIEEEA